MQNQLNLLYLYSLFIQSGINLFYANIRRQHEKIYPEASSEH